MLLRLDVAVRVRVELQAQAVFLRDQPAEIVGFLDQGPPLVVLQLGRLEEGAGMVVAVTGYGHEDDVLAADGGGQRGDLLGDSDDVPASRRGGAAR